MENSKSLFAFLKLAIVFAAGILTAKLFVAFCMWVIMSLLLLLGLAGGAFAAVIVTFLSIIVGIMSIFVFFVGCQVALLAMHWVRKAFGKEEPGAEEPAAAPEAAAAA